MNQAEKFIKNNKKLITLSIIALTLIVVLIPLLLNFFVMSWSTKVTFGNSDIWLGLWGNMISSIIGAFLYRKKSEGISSNLKGA